MSYRYTDLSAPPPPVTAESMLQAWDEGRAACAARRPGRPRPPNPYDGECQALAFVWRAGYDVEDQPRLKRVTAAEDAATLTA